MKGSLHGKPVTIANIYTPNTKQAPFFRSMMQLLSAFQEDLLVLGGDFNVPLNPPHDTSTGTSTIPYRALCAVKTQLQDLALHDSWRTLYPKVKDYTFYSAPHNWFSRLDYPFITQRDLTMLTTSTIDPMYLSDHHPISMSIEFSDIPTQSSIWRLDPSLLTDSTIAPEVNRILLRENNSPDISPMLRWEAHNCTIRGELIVISAKRSHTLKN